MAMRETSYQDERGRWHAVLLPAEAGEWEAPRGVPLGPPDVDPLGLPDDIATRLNNELFARRLFRLQDIGNNMPALQSAIASALRVDVAALAGLYSA